MHLNFQFLLAFPVYFHLRTNMFKESASGEELPIVSPLWKKTAA